MNYKNTWQTDLEEYIRQGEPEQSEKSIAWKTAIGLQDVDGLKTSEYPSYVMPSGSQDAALVAIA